MDRVIPEVYKKLLNTSPVTRWNQEIQIGVYNMTVLVIELIAIRLNQNGLPEVLLNTLNIVSLCDTMYDHFFLIINPFYFYSFFFL